MASHAKKAMLTEEERKAAWRESGKRTGEMNRIFATPEELREAISGYFADCDEKGLLYGEAGLCLWLGSHNANGRIITLDRLRKWYDGEASADLQEVVQEAYMRIQGQIESDRRYQDKAMTSRAIFLQKQTRFGGYQDKVEQKRETTVHIVHGEGVETSDFE